MIYHHIAPLIIPGASPYITDLHGRPTSRWGAVVGCCRGLQWGAAAGARSRGPQQGAAAGGRSRGMCACVCACACVCVHVCMHM